MDYVLVSALAHDTPVWIEARIWHFLCRISKVFKQPCFMTTQRICTSLVDLISRGFREKGCHIGLLDPVSLEKKTAFANATVKSLFLFGIHHNLFSPFEGDGIWRPALTEFQVFVPYHLESFLDSWTMIFLFLSHRFLMVTFCERDKAYNLGYFKAREGSPYHLLCQKDS